MSGEPEWPPAGALLTAIFWRVDDHLDRREYLAAVRTLEEGLGLGCDERLYGLRHLAAAGYKGQLGEGRRARRQLEHARRRLAAFPETAPQLDAVGRSLGS